MLNCIKHEYAKQQANRRIGKDFCVCKTIGTRKINVCSHIQRQTGKGMRVQILSKSAHQYII